VISSTAATADPTDYELRIEVTGTVTLHADIQLAGSLLVKAAAIDVYDQTLVARGPQRKLRFEATGPITFGRVGELDGQRRQLGAVIGATDLEIIAGGALTVSSGSILYSPEAGAAMTIEAGSAVVAGSILAGADLDASRLPVWMAPGSAILNIAGDITFGGTGVNDLGQDVPRGGNVRASMSCEYWQAASSPRARSVHWKWMQQRGAHAKPQSPAHSSSMPVVTCSCLDWRGLWMPERIC
jgi:hypothetical protein